MLEMDAMIATLEFVARSDWVTILPSLISVNDIGRGELIVNPIVEPPLHAEFVVIQPTRRTLSTQARLFLRTLRGGGRAHPRGLGEASSPSRPMFPRERSLRARNAAESQPARARAKRLASDRHPRAVRVHRLEHRFQRRHRLQDAGVVDLERALPERRLGEIIQIARRGDCRPAGRSFPAPLRAVHDERASRSRSRPRQFSPIDRDAPDERRLEGGGERAGGAVLEFDQRGGGVAGRQLQARAPSTAR